MYSDVCKLDLAAAVVLAELCMLTYGGESAWFGHLVKAQVAAPGSMCLGAAAGLQVMVVACCSLFCGSL
jgi:hypothetical protein